MFVRKPLCSARARLGQQRLAGIIKLVRFRIIHHGGQSMHPPSRPIIADLFGRKIMNLA